MVKTLGVYAGAYPKAGPLKYLTHAVEHGADGRMARVYCSRVRLENVCEEPYPNADAANLRPTCRVCSARDPRFKGMS